MGTTVFVKVVGFREVERHALNTLFRLSDDRPTTYAVWTPDAPVMPHVALIDGPTAAAAGCMSLSSWHELVRKGEAPAPVIRQPRCTRWTLVSVRAWLIERASRGSDTEAATRMAATASKASAAAKRKRAAAKVAG